MASVSLSTAIEMRDAWINAEKSVMKGQSISIQGREVRRADLSEIRQAIQYWSKIARQLDRKRRGKGTMRISSIVPMDR